MESQGLAKTAPSPQQDKQAVTAPALKSGTANFGYEKAGVPLDLYMFYDKSFSGEDGATITQLKSVYDYAKGLTKDGTNDQVIKALSDLDIHLGVPSGGESRLGRAYNNIKMLQILRKR